MSDNCKEKVFRSGGWGSRQCSRNAVIDGYCRQHHPDAVAERKRKSDEAEEAKWQSSPIMKLGRAKAKIERLTKENERLRFENSLLKEKLRRVGGLRDSENM